MYHENPGLRVRRGEARANPTVIIGDLHPAFANALSNIYLSESIGTRVLTTTSYAQLQDWAVAMPGAVVLVNPRMEGAPGLGTPATLQEQADIAQLVLLIEEENTGLSAYFLNEGADATIAKTADMTTISRVLLGEQNSTYEQDETEIGNPAFSVDFYEGLANLTRRQATILTYLKEGKLNKQIAHELGISEATVKHHVSALLSTLGFYSRSQLVAMINALGISVDYRQAAAAAKAKVPEQKQPAFKRAVAPRSVSSRQTQVGAYALAT